MTEILENIVEEALSDYQIFQPNIDKISSDSEIFNKNFSIIIEQQIKANIRTQKLAQHLWSYFYLKFGTKDPNFCLKFVPSHLKTQYFLGKNKLDNRMRKKWAVTKVHEILNKCDNKQNQSILTQIGTLKKQDDVCDSILQSIAFLKISF